ncbi:MAG: penicillin-binding protein 2 [Anaerolineae bacterium]
MASVQPAPSRDQMFNQRLPFVIIGMVIASVLLVFKLVSFQQLSLDVVNELRPDYNRTVNLAAARGLIYDQSGQRLAVNTLEYRVGLSPNLVANPQRTATQLAGILNLDELTVYQATTSDKTWELLAAPVSAEVGQQIEQLKQDGLTALTIEKIPRRSYPQGALAAQVLGFVGGELQGYYGVEGKFQDQLTGRPRTEVVSNIPFDVPSEQEADKGSDIYLTLDRDIQFLIESQLLSAVQSTGAKSGTIIVMNPRSGDILGLANYPSYDPNDPLAVKDTLWKDTAISNEYEPGSVMKVVTVAAALDKGTITPNWTYNDQAVLDMAGIKVQNWDRQAHGVVDTTNVLVQSLNVGAATISLAMGPTDYYAYMSKFGFGKLTGVNLEGEASGTMHVPGDSDWSESNLLTNAYGQGVAVTPLQMITAVSAIANDGLMMQPNIVAKIVNNNGQVNVAQPIALGRPITQDTAHTVRDMMVAVVQNGLDDGAQLPGYTVAGKTGTAEIPVPLGYKQDAWIMSFIGFLPADDPQVIVLIKLDEPTTGRWASQVVAPVFRQLAQRLVVLMEIPPDAVRLALKAEGAAASGQGG